MKYYSYKEQRTEDEVETSKFGNILGKLIEKGTILPP